MTASREVRERRALLGWTLFVLAFVAALLGVWLGDEKWFLTAAVLLAGAAAFGMGSWS